MEPVGNLVPELEHTPNPNNSLPLAPEPTQAASRHGEISAGKARNVLRVLPKQLITAQADFEQIRGWKRRKYDGVLQFCRCIGGTVREHPWESPGHSALGPSATTQPVLRVPAHAELAVPGKRHFPTTDP